MGTPFKIKDVHRDIILQMTRREDILRKSDKIQDLYDRIKYLKGEYTEIYVQKTVLDEFGFSATDDDLAEYQSIYNNYKDDTEIVNSVIYMRYRYMFRECPIQQGSDVPNVPLLFQDRHPCQLSDFMTNDKPLVVVGGSAT